MPITRFKKRGSSRKSSSKQAGLNLSSKVRKPARQDYQPKRSSRRKTLSSPPSLLGNISPERKVDLIGVAMVLVGLLTVVSFFSARNGGLTGDWIGALKSIFGLGVYILPVGLIVLGAWLVARNVDRLPELNIERIIGILLLFVGLLVAFHGLSGPAATAIERGKNGLGGGTLGALLQRGLVGALGGAGAAILVVAWLLVALAMTLDLSMQELFHWIVPLVVNLKGRLNQRLVRRAKGLESDFPLSGELLENFTSFQHPLVTPQTTVPPGVTVRTNISNAPLVTWLLPKSADILQPAQAPAINEEFIATRARLIEATLASFGAPAQVVEISRGPTITMFGVEPLFVEGRSGQMRVRVGKIASLADDLALALAVTRIRIQAPVPGHGYVGIEVPNEEMTLVTLREMLESQAFTRGKPLLRFALGKDVSGHPVSYDLTSMPHLLIAGTTGSGKSVCVNSILSCLLMNNTPDDLRFILVDPKRVELTSYNGVPHLLAPVVVEIERVIGALQWMTREMDNRYHKFAEIGARNIQDYNARLSTQGGKKLPFLIVVIDELADLMMIAPDETERTITRLAQLARATGIHMIIATQRPSVDVVTGLIKANFPARIAFAVASNTDSRVILDQPGAERLLGRGDMLFQAPDSPSPVRLQGVFVSDAEINRLVDYWRNQAGAASPYAVTSTSEPVNVIPPGVPLKQVPMFEDMTPESKGDPLLGEATDLIRREGRASVSMLQRRMRIGYTRAARLMDTLEEQGIVGPPEPGSGVRTVLDYGPAAPPKEE